MGFVIICSGGRPEISEAQKEIIKMFIEEQQKKEEEEIIKMDSIKDSIVEFKPESLADLEDEKPYFFNKKKRYINTSKHNKFYKR